MFVNLSSHAFARGAAASGPDYCKRPFISRTALALHRLRVWRAGFLLVLLCSLPIAAYAGGTVVDGVSLVVSSPASGSVLSGSSVTFTMQANSAVSNYLLYVGTTPQPSDNVALLTTGST